MTLFGVLGFSVDLSEQVDAAIQATSANMKDVEEGSADLPPQQSSDVSSIGVPSIDPATNPLPVHKPEIDEPVTSPANAPAVVEIYPAVQTIDEHEVRLILVLVLPDGSRSLIPAAWTDWPSIEASSPVPIADPLDLIGETDDLLSIRSHVDVLLQRARSEESHHATDAESSDTTDPP